MTPEVMPEARCPLDDVSRSNEADLFERDLSRCRVNCAQEALILLV